ncbi:MAG: hypothetical protein SWK76_12270 [Actinomycetota bacterium]|nr:hypothetical protein [Actinomycetota bacterium]
MTVRGLKPIAATAKFYIEDLKSPLEGGEEERAFKLSLKAGKLLMTPAD